MMAHYRKYGFVSHSLVFFFANHDDFLLPKSYRLNLEENMIHKIVEVFCKFFGGFFYFDSERMIVRKFQKVISWKYLWLLKSITNRRDGNFVLQIFNSDHSIT